MKKKIVFLLLISLSLIGCEKINTPEKIEKRKLEAKILRCEYEKNLEGLVFLEKLLERGEKENDEKLIKRIVIAFSRIRNPRTLNYLFKLTKYRDHTIRASAVFAIGEILKKENREDFSFKLNSSIKEKIRNILSDSSILVRANLLDALGKMGDDCGISFKKLFFYKSVYSDLEIYFLHQLLKSSFRLNKKELISNISPYLLSKDKTLLYDSLFSLRILLKRSGKKINLSKKVVKNILQCKDKFILASFIRLFPYVSMEDVEKLSLLKGFLNSKFLNVRIEAIRELGRIGNKSSRLILMDHFLKIFDSLSEFPDSSERVFLNEIKENLTALRGFNNKRWKKILLNLYKLYPYFRVYLAISYLSSFNDRDDYFIKTCRTFSTEDHYLRWVSFLSSSHRKKFLNFSKDLFSGLSGFNIDVNWILSGRVLIAENLVKRGEIDPFSLLKSKYSPLREIALQNISSKGENFIISNAKEIVGIFKKHISSQSVGDKLLFIDISKYLGSGGKEILENFVKNKNYILRIRSVAVLKKFFGEDLYKVALSFKSDKREDFYYQTALNEELPIIMRVKATCGNFQIRLSPKVAPFAVENFLTLSATDYYFRNVFHRVIPDFVIQWGGLRGCGYFDSGYTIPSEFSSLFFRPFSLGEANGGMDTPSTQLFITLSMEPHLEGYYTIFGRVVGGFDVVEKISQNDMILKITQEYPFPPYSVKVVE